MSLVRKNLMVDAEQLAELAYPRGSSESAAVREAVENALFAEDFAAAMEQLRAVGYGTITAAEDDDGPVVYEDDPPAKRHRPLEVG
jgi:predicted DNA-binding protein